MNQSKTFRLFISSTFSDFQKERQVLHERVFPKINTFLQNNYPTYSFQPIDLRWGVSEEAQLDQKTLDLCLNEVKSCKHYLHPNFLIMVGNRYGWIPLPYAIERKEFETVVKHTKKEKLGLLQKWYRLDVNHIPQSYILMERKPDSIYSQYEEWEKVENELRGILHEAVNAIFKSEGDKKVKKPQYFLSATEAEVKEGVFKYLEPTIAQKRLEKEQAKLQIAEQKDFSQLDDKYVFGFIRNINYEDVINYNNEPYKSYIDKNQTAVKGFKEELKNTGINIMEEDVTFDISDDQIFQGEEKYLKNVEKYIFEKIKTSIEEQIKKQEKLFPTLDSLEKSEQERFRDLKIETFVGREDKIKTVKQYIDNPSAQPLLIHGRSGIGKSAFMAELTKVILYKNDETKRDYLVYRFIGATAASSDIRALLISLVEECSKKGVLNKPSKYEEETYKFFDQIKKLLESVKKPVIIILDALDQLQTKDNPLWIPVNYANNNLKIILSVLDEDDTYYCDKLNKHIDKNNHLSIEKLSDDNIKEALKNLLEKSKRTLTDLQEKYVLEQIKISGNSPLYLRVAFEEVKTWRSFDQEKLSVGIDGIIKEYIDNLTIKFHHSKKIVYKVLGWIKVSKDGLSEKELLDLLSRDEAILNSLEKHNHKLVLNINGEEVRKFPTSAWVRLYDQIKPFTMTRLIDGQNLIKFFHKQIDQVVGDYICEFDKDDLHKDIEEYFKFTYDNSFLVNEKLDKCNLRILEEYPYHLAKINSGKELHSVLSDETFILAKIVNNKYDSLLKDFERVMNPELIIRNIYKMLRDLIEKRQIVETFKYQFYLQQLYLLDKNYFSNICLDQYQNTLVNVSDNFYGSKILEAIFSGHNDVVKHLCIKDEILVSSDFHGNVIIRNLNNYESRKYKIFEIDINNIVIKNELLFVSSGNNLTVISLDGDTIKKLQVTDYIKDILVTDNEVFIVSFNKIYLIYLDSMQIKNIFEINKYSSLNAYLENNILCIEFKLDEDDNFEFQYYDSAIQQFKNRTQKEKPKNIIFSDDEKIYCVEDENILIEYNKTHLSEINKIELFDYYFAVTEDSEVYYIHEYFILMMDHRSDNRLIFINLKDKRICDEIFHSKMIWDVKVNEKFIFTCSNDGLIKMWSIEELLKYRYDSSLTIESIYEKSIILDTTGQVELIPSVTSSHCMIKSQRNSEEEPEYMIFNAKNGNYNKMNWNDFAWMDENWNESFHEFSYEGKMFKIEELLSTPHKTTPIMLDTSIESVESCYFLSDPIFIVWDQIYGTSIDVNNHFVIFRTENYEFVYENNGIEKSAVALKLDFSKLFIVNQNGFIMLYDTTSQELINAIFLGESIDSFAICDYNMVCVCNGEVKCIELK